MLVHRDSIVAKAPEAAAITVALPLVVTGYLAWTGDRGVQAVFASAFAICSYVLLAAIYFLIAKRGN